MGTSQATLFRIPACVFDKNSNFCTTEPAAQCLEKFFTRPGNRNTGLRRLLPTLRYGRNGYAPPSPLSRLEN